MEYKAMTRKSEALGLLIWEDLQYIVLSKKKKKKPKMQNTIHSKLPQFLQISAQMSSYSYDNRKMSQKWIKWLYGEEGNGVRGQKELEARGLWT